MKDLALFIAQLKNADRTTVEFVDGVLHITCEKDAQCLPEEKGTGVMEDFTEKHDFKVTMADLKLSGIRVDN